MSAEPEYWSTNRDAEILYATTVEEAVDDWIDTLEANEYETPPETITVYGWARTQPSVETYTGLVLERLLESLDEEHADDNVGYTQPTEAMLAAERTFVSTVLAEYEPWTCECVTERVVETAPYIAAQREADARYEARQRAHERTAMEGEQS